MTITDKKKGTDVRRELTRNPLILVSNIGVNLLQPSAPDRQNVTHQLPSWRELGPIDVGLPLFVNKNGHTRNRHWGPSSALLLWNWSVTPTEWSVGDSHWPLLKKPSLLIGILVTPMDPSSWSCLPTWDERSISSLTILKIEVFSCTEFDWTKTTDATTPPCMFPYVRKSLYTQDRLDQGLSSGTNPWTDGIDQSIPS